MFVLYASNLISHQNGYDNKDEEDAKRSQGETDRHKDTHCIIEKIENWQPDRGEERGYGYRYSELVRYVDHTIDIVSVTKRRVNQGGRGAGASCLHRGCQVSKLGLPKQLYPERQGVYLVMSQSSGSLALGCFGGEARRAPRFSASCGFVVLVSRCVLALFV